MVAKRKAISTIVKDSTQDSENIKGKAKVGKMESEVMKKPAGSTRSKEEDEEVDPAEPMEDNEDEEEEEEEEEEKPEDMSEEQKQEMVEEQEVAKRTKELKATPVNEIKDLVAKLGLETGNKADMIQAIVGQEAKLRADARAEEAKIRAVVLQKKQEFDAESVSSLAKLCQAIGIKGIMSKQDRVQCLLKQWQEDDGVEKALQKNALAERKVELEAMDKSSLQGLCEKVNIDPLIAELMVDRIVKKEHEMGHFARPVQKDETSETASKKEKDVDMVTAFLHNEKNRKKEKELKAQRQEEMAKRLKKLQDMSIQDLKKELTSKGVEPTGKKDEMVKALLEVKAQEDKVTARKAELKAMGTQGLKEFCANRSLKTGSIGEMVTAVLAFEAKEREEMRIFEEKAVEMLAQKKEELNSKSNSQLKELCASKNLKLGVAKEERLERLLEEAKRDGEIDALVTRILRKSRRDALLATAKEELAKMCKQLEVDPLAKEVMIERILEHENEFGQVVVEPPTKKARTSKK